MRRWSAVRVVAVLVVGALATLTVLVTAQDMRELARHPGAFGPRLPYTNLPPDPNQVLDLELSNVVLATAIDGCLLGIDRTNGAVLWDLSAQTRAVPDLLQPLVSTHFGAQHRTLEQLAADAVKYGDAETLRVLESGGIYVVEPSNGGDLYMLRTRTEHGEVRPQLEKMPFSLPDLVALSPFSLSSDDTRIFVAEKRTRLVELNVFTGTIGTVFDAKDAYLHDFPTPQATYAGARADDHAGYDAIESPWVYVGRTDYTLTVHVRSTPNASQTLHYSVYAPNSVDQDIAALWAQHGSQIDTHGILVAPEDQALVCFDLSRLRTNARASPPPMPPVVWTRTLNTSVVDLFDVVFVPPTSTTPDTPLLHPVIVPHNPKDLAHVVEQQRRGVSQQLSSAYLGMSPSGTLYALGRSRYPLVELASPAAATRGRLTGANDASLQPWLGGYDVPNQVPLTNVPLLDAPHYDHRPQIGAPPSMPVLSWHNEATRLLILRIAGLAFFVFVIVRGYLLIRKDRTPLILNTETLHFDAERPREVPEKASDKPVEKTAEKAPVARAATPAPAEANNMAASGTPRAEADDASDDDEQRTAAPTEDDAKPKRRRRGKRAGAAVLARQSTPARTDEAGERARTTSSSPSSSPAPAVTAMTPAGEPIAPSTLQISEEVLGYGSSGTVVFRGTFQGRAVAVKRLLRDFVLMASKEVSLLQSADNHPNVIRYYCQELTHNFLYIALEQCPASLADLVERPVEHAQLAQLLEPRNAFKQITAGLQHLHSLSIVHRDIKPQNILVTLTAQNKLRMLLSDFGLSKRMDGLAQSSFSQSVNQPGGTVGWRAPEVLQGHRTLLSRPESEENARLTRAVDIFSLGCVAFYLLTGGKHPFGSQYEREMHIMQNRPDLSALDATCEDTVEAHALIARMIAPQPADRPSADRVAQHPFFWNAQRKLAFLQDVSDRLETMERDPPSLASQVLERNADAVIGGDWRRRFDRAFLEDLGRFRKYDKSSVQDLLRVIRNKKHHFQDMQPQLKKQLSPMPEGFLAFFVRRFPQLFLHVYEALEELPMLRSEAVFHTYYQDEDA
ncbi:non-specific serine/threonine protein kinase [Malassezia brasiliensis]|uniref:non-specific serine/threonine protein kinase n=1 Tax=Malassezia brasiliensis TaxID=1821822 RepID=A0AAF0DPW7_9BASI|nr:non-specific serine/threonine protein kinase [Malassezia brasiliensis]